MSNCPLCGTAVFGDFGLIECGGCGAQLLVQVDGSLVHQGSEPAEAPTVMRTSEPEPEFTYNESEPPPVQEEEIPIDPEPEPEPEIAAVAEEPPPPPALATGEEYSFDEPEAPAPTSEAAAVSASPDLSDVAGFGNSSVSGGRDGSLRYNLIIDGIDTADVREAFREAITDRKLMWDIDTIIRNVHNGEVTIHNVSASKAYIVISRLRSLPVRIHWEQYAVHQT